MGAERVGNAVDERLLGTHHDDVGIDLTGEARHGGGIVGVDGDAPLAHRGDARIAGGGDDLVDRRRVVERPGQRVGASVAAENEDAHSGCPRQHDGLLAAGADRHEAHGNTGELLDEADVVARGARQVFDAGGGIDLGAPPRHRLVDGPHLVQHRLVYGTCSYRLPSSPS